MGGFNMTMMGWS